MLLAKEVIRLCLYLAHNIILPDSQTHEYLYPLALIFCCLLDHLGYPFLGYTVCPTVATRLVKLSSRFNFTVH